MVTEEHLLIHAKNVCYAMYPIVDKKTDTFTVTVPVVLGDAFFGWVLSMRNKVTIVDPPRVEKMMKEIFADVGKDYK